MPSLPNQPELPAEWYCRDMYSKVTGPLTAAQFHDMVKSGRFPSFSTFRCGEKSDWESLPYQLGAAMPYATGGHAPTEQPAATLAVGERVERAAFSPDGRLVVTSHGLSKTARVWEAATGKLAAELVDQDGWVQSARFSPDGGLIVTALRSAAEGAAAMPARVWDVAAGKPVAALAGHSHDVYSARFSPDGRLVATASQDGGAQVWEASSFKAIARLGHKGFRRVNSARFSADGRLVVTASDDFSARVWETATGAPVAALEWDRPVTDAHVSPDGRLALTSAEGNRTVRLWDVAARAPVAAFEKQNGKRKGISAARFSPDGRLVVTAHDDGAARIWAATGESLAVLPGHKDQVSDARFSADGRFIVTAGSDASARVWDTALCKCVATLRGHRSLLRQAQFSPDGRLVATTAPYDNCVQLWAI